MELYLFSSDKKLVLDGKLFKLSLYINFFSDCLSPLSKLTYFRYLSMWGRIRVKNLGLCDNATNRHILKMYQENKIKWNEKAKKIFANSYYFDVISISHFSIKKSHGKHLESSEIIILFLKGMLSWKKNRVEISNLHLSHCFNACF